MVEHHVIFDDGDEYWVQSCRIRKEESFAMGQSKSLQSVQKSTVYSWWLSIAEKGGQGESIIFLLL